VFGTVELERSWKNGSRAVPNTPYVYCDFCDLLPLGAKTQEGHSHGGHMGVTNPIKATCELHLDFVRLFPKNLHNEFFVYKKFLDVCISCLLGSKILNM
jgi:hypothetical protein